MGVKRYVEMVAMSGDLRSLVCFVLFLGLTLAVIIKRVILM